MEVAVSVRRLFPTGELLQRNEHRNNPRGLADLLLPYALIDDGHFAART
jgi:hypothetical protein